MGLQADCTVRYGTQTSAGKAQLEEKEILFRGDFRLKVPLADIKKADVKGGALTIAWKGGEARLDLGAAAAARWADTIKHPRSRMDKLGVKPGAKVAVLGFDDDAFIAELRERTDRIVTARPGKGTAIVVVAMKAVADLQRLATLRKAIEPDGMIWVVWPKGVAAFREDDVRAAGPSVGLVDVKVMSFSDTLSGLKMVVPKALRGSR
jgi:hypothetical protein